MENIALRIWQILYTFVLRVENNTQLIPLGIQEHKTTEDLPTSQGYIFYSLQHFTNKLCNFTKFRMLFQAEVIFFPFRFFLKFRVKG